MTDYATLKVPELKKLLQEKSLPVTGNKADLIARLSEHDKSSEPAKPGESLFHPHGLVRARAETGDAARLGTNVTQQLPPLPPQLPLPRMRLIGTMTSPPRLPPL